MATVVIAAVNLREQRKLTERGIAEQRELTERGIAEQRRSAREQRIWDTRVDLYVNLLVWLNGKSTDIEELRTEVRKQQNEASIRDIGQRFHDLLTVLKPTSVDSSGVREGHTAATSPDPGQAGVVALWRLLDPPVELGERLRLYASVNIRAAFDTYKAESALPMLAGDNVDVLVVTLENSADALSRFRDAIIREIHEFTGKR